MSPQDRRTQIEELLRQRRWPDFPGFTATERPNYWVLQGPTGFWPPRIILGPRGGITIDEFRSTPGYVQDGSDGHLTALIERSAWQGH